MKPHTLAAAAALGFLPLGSAPGATFYVDYAGGSDSNRGLSADSAFRHCPGDSAFAGRASLAPGDTVVFKGGVTYEGFIRCPADGVTYDGNSAGTFGHGRAVLSGRNDPAQVRGFTAVGRTGIAFRNFEVENYGGHGDRPWSGTEKKGFNGYGISLDSCTRIRVSGCLFHDIGDWRNEPGANEGYMEGVGLAVIDSGSAIEIDGNEFTRIGRAGIMIEPKQGSRVCTDISIRQNDFHDYLRWGVWLATANSGCTLNGVTIAGNRFHDFYQYAVGRWRGLAGDAPHVDCIIAYIGSLPPQGGQTLGTADRPITIKDNLFYNGPTVAQVQNSAVFLDTWGGRVVITGNLFRNVLFDGNGAVFCLEGTDTSVNPPPDYWIAGNRFEDSTYAVTLESQRYPLDRGSIHIRNNVFDKPDAGYGFSVRVMDRNSVPTELDYDTYFTGRPDNLLAILPGGTQTLAQLRRHGYEQHGRQTREIGNVPLACIATENP